MDKLTKIVLSLALMLISQTSVQAFNYMNADPLVLDAPDLMGEAMRQMKQQPSANESLKLKKLKLPTEAAEIAAMKGETPNAVPSAAPAPAPGYFQELFSLKSAEGVKPYKFMDDLSFAGVPLFVAGIIAKSEKKSFRQNYDDKVSKTRLLTNFHSEIDNYTQFAPFALSTVLNLAGVKGRSTFPRYAVSSALSFAFMAAIVNPLKYSVKEMRPDGSTANSWPSGHTATVFTAATILHKEYGMTRSPWYSVGAYVVATATGAMRVLNNRHWVSDVLSGAGVGIMSTELGYAIADLIFKGKGLNRNDLMDHPNLIEQPSFFSVNMGLGLGNKTLDFGDYEFKFRSSTVLGVEGAYFLNKYIGVGGRLRMRTTPIGNFREFVEEDQTRLDNTIDKIEDLTGNMPIDYAELTIEQDHLTEFNGAAGVYLNYPLSERFALGTKLLVGYDIMSSLNVGAFGTGTETYSNLDWSADWDYLSIDADNAMTYGTGLSLTYSYRSNFSWKIFMEYDFSRKNYTMTYDPHRWMKISMSEEVANRVFGTEFDEEKLSVKKNMNTFVIGGSFVVSF